MEKVRRLKIDPEVCRELYLKSGNRCAFPNCNHVIVDENGIYVGEIAHIVAAEEVGPRFDSSMTNKKRAAYSNLILLCPNHHTLIDKKESLEEYTVQVLQNMKAEHEKKFSTILDEMIEKFNEKATPEEEIECLNCNKLNRILNWGNSEEELKFVVEEFNKIKTWLAKVDGEPSYLFAKLLKYSQETYLSGNKRIFKLTEIESKLSSQSKLDCQKIWHCLKIRA